MSTPNLDLYSSASDWGKAYPMLNPLMQWMNQQVANSLNSPLQPSQPSQQTSGGGSGGGGGSFGGGGASGQWSNQPIQNQPSLQSLMQPKQSADFMVSSILTPEQRNERINRAQQIASQQQVNPSQTQVANQPQGLLAQQIAQQQQVNPQQQNPQQANPQVMPQQANTLQQQLQQMQLNQLEQDRLDKINAQARANTQVLSSFGESPESYQARVQAQQQPNQQLADIARQNLNTGISNLQSPASAASAAQQEMAMQQLKNKGLLDVANTEYGQSELEDLGNGVKLNPKDGSMYQNGVKVGESNPVLAEMYKATAVMNKAPAPLSQYQILEITKQQQKTDAGRNMIDRFSANLDSLNSTMANLPKINNLGDVAAVQTNLLTQPNQTTPEIAAYETQRNSVAMNALKAIENSTGRPSTWSMQQIKDSLPKWSDTEAVKQSKMAIFQNQVATSIGVDFKNQKYQSPYGTSSAMQGQTFNSEQEAISAGLAKGSIITINGRLARID